MKVDKIRKELNQIFRDVFDDDGLKINNKTNANSIKKWDSFMQMNLILSIESKFKLSLSSRDIEKLKNVGDMISLLDKKLNE